MGIVRRVLPGVEYPPEPPVSVELTTWTRVAGDQLTFEMPCDLKPESTTFEDFADRLAAVATSRQGLDEKLLDTLDHIVLKLVSIARTLHSSSLPLYFGLVHPGNILLVGSAQRPKVAAPDCGFYYDEVRGSKCPKWLESTDRQVFWDKSPQEVNKLIASGGWTCVNDLRSIARLIAYLLVGREKIEEWSGGPSLPLRNIPSSDAAQETGADVWRVLSDVLNDDVLPENRITTAAGLLSRLTGESSPSEHFRFAPRQSIGSEGREGRGLFRRFVKVCGTLLVAGAVAGLLVLAGRTYLDGPVKSPPILCPDCPGNSKLGEDLQALYELGREPSTDLTGSIDRLEQELEILQRLHRPELLHEKQVIRLRELECLKIVRAACLKRLDATADRLLEDNYKGDFPTQSLPGPSGRFVKIDDELKALSPDRPPLESPAWRRQLAPFVK